MNRLTLMQMQAPAQHHDSRMKLTVTNSSSRAYSETIDRISSQSPALQVAAPDIPPVPVRPAQRKSLVNRALALHKLFQPEPLASAYDHRYR
jgi:DNA-directed RNA polymerase alpha subunit